MARSESTPPITVVIPAKNEAQTLAKVIQGVRGYTDDIIVVDGHSTDGTREIARNLGVQVESDRGKGKGDAVRQALQIATGDIVVFIDADGSHDPDDIPKLVKPIIEDQADHVSGSRMLGGSDELFGSLGEVLRLLGSLVISLGINYRFGVKLTDAQNGFRAIRGDVGRSLGLQENITTIEQEMVIKTLRQGYRLVEVPTHEYRRKFGESKIRLSNVWFRYVYSWIKYMLF